MLIITYNVTKITIHKAKKHCIIYIKKTQKHLIKFDYIIYSIINFYYLY